MRVVDITPSSSGDNVKCSIGFDHVGTFYRMHLRLSGPLPLDASLTRMSSLALSPGSGGIITVPCIEGGKVRTDPASTKGRPVLEAVYRLERPQLILLALYPVQRLRVDMGTGSFEVAVKEPAIHRALTDSARAAIGALVK